MRLEAILACDKILREPNGKVHLSGIFDRIFTATVPALHRELYIYFRFVVDEEEQNSNGQNKLTLEFRGPDGTTERMPDIDVKVGVHNKVEGTIRIAMLPLRNYGLHTFNLMFNETQVGVYQFECATPGSPGGPNETIH